MREEIVTYVGFAGILKGIMAFYHHKGDSICAKPHVRYDHSKDSGGYCHTNSPTEMDRIAEQIGAMTRTEFIAQHYKQAWCNDYGHYLSNELGRALQTSGVVVEIEGEKVRFVCPKEAFVVWRYGAA